MRCLFHPSAEGETNGQRWRVVKLPALAETDDPLGRAPGEALWPEVYSRETLEKARASRTAYYWQAVYQQNPLAEGATEWPESFFGPDIWFDQWPEAFPRMVRTIALDPSKGNDSKHGDYSASVLLYVTPDATLYVDADLDRRNVSVIAETAVELCRSFQPDAFVVETNQFQELLAHDIQRAAERRGIYELPLCHTLIKPDRSCDEPIGGLAGNAHQPIRRRATSEKIKPATDSDYERLVGVLPYRRARPSHAIEAASTQ